MATNVDVSQLNGLFKEVYAKNIETLIPSNQILTKMIKFNHAETGTGNLYHQPVKVTQSHGFTYAAPGSGAFSLNSPIALTTKDAQLDGSSILLRDRIGYEAAAKATSAGPKAFYNATRYVIECMTESLNNRLEIAMLYGQSGIAKAASSANASATSTVVTIKTSDWAVGIWSGMENAEINFYNSTSLISSGSDSVFTVSAVDVDARTVTLTGTSTGISALDTAIAANPNTLDVYFNGAYSNEMVGLNKIITNTSTLFNINAAQYNLWRGNTHPVSGQLTEDKIMKAVEKAVGRGLMEDVVCLVNPSSWADLSSQLTSRRSFDSSYSKDKNSVGQRSIELIGQNGLVSIVSHNCVKEGDAFIVPLKQLVRVGAQAPTFTPFTKDNVHFFRELTDNAGFELRYYTHQALMCKHPAKTVKITGIVNS